MIGIVTDSTCDVPQTMVDEYGIKIVPQYIIWGDEQFRDRVDLQPEDFYHRLVSDKQRPTSSQATENDFKTAFEELNAKGITEIIVLTVSSAMSGTYQMALKAAKMVSFPVHVVDSKGPTMTLGWQVLAAARARDAGADSASILASIDKVRSKLIQLVGMVSLEYLQKGGRIGNAVKWVGSLMHVKPLVSINHSTGLVEPVTLCRTKKTLVESMLQKFYLHFEGTKKVHVAVLHGNVPDEARELADRIRLDLNPDELIINITGPVLGINTGPGALALCGYAEE